MNRLSPMSGASQAGCSNSGNQQLKKRGLQSASSFFVHIGHLSQPISAQDRLLMKTPSRTLFQQADNAKRGKLASSSETTLQDLPTEMLKCILVKAVTMEVKDLKLGKSVWKEKADLVIGRLQTVCMQWSHILTSNFFLNELHTTLDGIAQETIRLEIVHQSQMDCVVCNVTTMRDEVYIHCLTVDKVNPLSSYSFDIKVYDRSNMAEVKDVIALSKLGIRGAYIAACSLSNCLYVQDQNRESLDSSIKCIARDKEHKFNVHTLITDLPFGISSMSVYSNGSILIASDPDEFDCTVVSIYDPSGSLQREIELSPDIYGLSFVEIVVQKSNGNIVLASTDEQSRPVVMEISTDGVIEHQYKSSLSGRSRVTVADSFGRIAIIHPRNGMQLLDSQLNLLEFTPPQLKKNDFKFRSELHYNSQSNEVLGFRLPNRHSSILTIFRFRED